MSANGCVEIGDRLPDWVAGRSSASDADEIARHLAACAECSAQAAAIRAVWRARAEPPADLAGRIGAALAAAPPAPARRWMRWAGSAAAVLVLAVGSFVARAGDPGEPAELARLGQVVTEQSVWIPDDGVVAGAPVLDELSDDDLAALLQEMGG
jgi:hypothetical protein